MKSLQSWTGITFVTDPTHGDNGKGKIVDLLATRADMVIRSNGGANAGHTVENKFGVFAFHLMPSGIFNPKAMNILSDTVVVDPLILAQEILSLQKAGVSVSPKNLLVSRNAHLVMPWHKVRDNLREASRGKGKVGTTGRGIGPAYADRTERIGLRVGILLEKDWKTQWEKELDRQTLLIQAIDKSHSLFDDEALGKELTKVRKLLLPFITDVMPLIQQYYLKKKRILGEAGQGVMLDLDRGSYPYVTSSHPGLAGFNLATGIPPKKVDRVLGVIKAYATRVGEGPMPTELFDSIGDRIRTIGHEFGATTGRPRRCGWLDVPTLRYGIQVGGIDAIALTKLDIFDSFADIKICVAYRVEGHTYEILPTADNEFLKKATPVYLTLPGWKKETTQIKLYEKLPVKARLYVEKLEKLIGVPIEIVSVGPARDATMYR